MVKVSGSGISLNSPAGPMPSTTCNWSISPIACIAVVTPIPELSLVSNPDMCVDLPRIIPPLSHQKNDTRCTPASLALRTTSVRSISPHICPLACCAKAISEQFHFIIGRVCSQECEQFRGSRFRCAHWRRLLQFRRRYCLL